MARNAATASILMDGDKGEVQISTGIPLLPVAKRYQDSPNVSHY